MQFIKFWGCILSMATIIINLEAAIRRCSVKKDVLKNFTTFTGKHQVFSCEFCEIFKNTFFIEHLWWLLLLILGGRHYHILKDISTECFKILDD